MKASFATAAAALHTLINAAPLEKREGISSCGPSWMPVNNVKTSNGAFERTGYNTAVDAFCSKAGDQTVGGQLYLSMASEVWLGYGGPPTSTGINGYVYFEIHNKLDSDHVVDEQKCKDYLKELSKDGSKCYGGSDHDDTKGGTWQVGDDDVSYHALAEKIPPSQDALEKTIVLGEAISPLGDGGKGNTLDPFPLFSYGDAYPVNCHSHNDYERDTALYSALMAGCISVEADVYAKDGHLEIGHDGPSGETLVDLYIDPLKALLDEHGSIFPNSPDQEFNLLVDFKNDGDETWDLLVKELEPIRKYLSKGEGGAGGKVTVIASGNAIVDGDNPGPIDKAIDESSNPEKAIFVDARVHKNMDNFEGHAYFASAKYSDAQDAGDIEGQLQAAHDRGFKVRYWDIPGDSETWQDLLNKGVDRINVDDLQNVAAVDW